MGKSKGKGKNGGEPLRVDRLGAVMDWMYAKRRARFVKIVSLLDKTLKDMVKEAKEGLKCSD